MSSKQIVAMFVSIAFFVTGILAVRNVWFSPSSPTQSNEQPTAPAGSSDQPTDSSSAKQELPRFVTKLSGPYTHKNLTFYLVHGPDSSPGKSPLTLEEAMDRNIVVVRETGDVNELSIENVSRGDEVFVQAGDIVKGGQQDRMLSVDLVVPARSGRIPIDSFCVESDRWVARGQESRERFGSSKAFVPSKDLKLAAKQSKSQGEVWNKVEESQRKLSAATNSNAASSVSRSSLQLTMEQREVRSTSDDYTRFLEDIVDHKSDVIGIVMIINGKINSIDTYSSNALFVKLWPKLLRAASIEAVAESRDASQGKVDTDQVAAVLETSEEASVTEERKITDRIRMITRSSETALLLTTLDGEIALHRNFLTK